MYLNKISSRPYIMQSMHWIYFQFEYLCYWKNSESLIRIMAKTFNRTIPIIYTDYASSKSRLEYIRPKYHTTSSLRSNVMWLLTKNWTCKYFRSSEKSASLVWKRSVAVVLMYIVTPNFSRRNGEIYLSKRLENPYVWKTVPAAAPPFKPNQINAFPV